MTLIHASQPHEPWNEGKLVGQKARSRHHNVLSWRMLPVP